MCLALPALGLGGIFQAIGVATSAIGAIAGAQQASAVGEYNAKVAENNAMAARESAGYEASLMRDRLRQTIGAQRAAAAASGVDASSGTPVAVLGDTAAQGEMDVLARLYSGEAAATANMNDARLARAEAKAQRTAGFINAGTNLLSGFGRMAAARPVPYQPLGAR